MVDQLTSLPAWVLRIAWSVLTVFLAYLVGQFLTHTIGRRLTQWASRTQWKWDKLVLEALRRGIPLWSLLVGVYIAIGFWPLSEYLLTTFHRVVYVLLWLSITLICASLIGKLVILYGSQFQSALPVTSLTENIAKIIVSVLGILMILHGVGIPITPLLTALGVGGLAVALALQDTLSNLFSGFYLTVARHVRVGDYVKLESGEEGYVEDIGWRATKIRTLPNNMVLVPNNKLSQAIITNFYLPSSEMAVLVQVGVDYASDLAHVERVTTEVAREIMQTVSGGVPEFEPFIRYHTFGDFSIQFTVILRGREFVDQYLVKHEFIKRLHARYQQEGITIPFPTRTIMTKSAAEPASNAESA